MRKYIREAFRRVIMFYPFEKGKHAIVNKIYLPYLSPKKEQYKIITAYNNIKFKVNLSKYIEAHLFLYRDYELPTLRFIKEIINEQFTIFDIGSNIGFMSLVFANKVKKIYAFEAESNNFNDLISNIHLNSFKNIFAFNIAITNEDKLITFYVVEGNNSGIHSTLLNKSLPQKSIQVQGISIDSFVSQNNIQKVDLIKMDIEGAEMDAIWGMQHLLSRDKPIIITEMAAEQQNLNGVSIKSFKLNLAQLGYNSYKITKTGKLLTSSIDEFHLSDNIVFAHTDNTPRGLVIKN